MSRIAGALLVVLVLWSTGCAAPQHPDETLPDPELEREHADFVAVLTEGVTIWAEDGSFVLEAGEPQEVPFTSSHPSYKVSELIDRYDDFLERGGRRVRVGYPGRSTPLYGVLSLIGVHTTAKESSARRAYRIAIPPRRVQQARGAQVAVVYQPYEYVRTVEEEETVTLPGGPLQPDGSYTREVHVEEDWTAVSWVLWISDAPFAGHDPDWSPPER